jgi:hypothetical protein
VRRQNIEKFNKQLGEVTDGARRRVLLALLAAEIAKPVEPGKPHHPG